eukprot:maker-scaffold570_size134912-snap-gene-0.10 protein:Tk08980 transcript:maker-scaffold570_size134912-snap-gene-0.10-mRNA-1 annotation:"conserved hypothetical protein"
MASPAPPPTLMSFTGFQTYICTVARLCRDTSKYTDVVLECADGQLQAHRLVLGSASPFLRRLFQDHAPGGAQDVHILIPNTRRAVVATLLEFLYTGTMVLNRKSTYDLQQLVHILQIDPENVRIDTPSEDPEQAQLVQAKITALKGGVQVASPPQPESDHPAEGHTTRPQRTAAKRQAPPEAVPPTSTPNGPPKAKELKLTLPNRVTNGKKLRSHRTNRRPDLEDGSGTISVDTPSGFHDMSNVHTWVCAICKQFDPILPPGMNPSQAPETEWVGCDCDRWYHKRCTKLSSIDDSFSCVQVSLTCLPLKDS